MVFTEQSIEEFIEIWQSEFGTHLSPDQARMEATRLMELYWLLAQPLPGDDGYEEGHNNQPLP